MLGSVFTISYVDFSAFCNSLALMDEYLSNEDFPQKLKGRLNEYFFFLVSFNAYKKLSLVLKEFTLLVVVRDVFVDDDDGNYLSLEKYLERIRD